MTLQRPLVLINGVLRQLPAGDTVNSEAPLWNRANWTQIPGFATDTILDGSVITLPISQLQVGTRYRCKFSVEKTGAGSAAPTITLRIGTTGTIADAAILPFAFPAQSAISDQGVFDLDANFSTLGASNAATMHGFTSLIHFRSALGFSVQTSPVINATSFGFTSTTAGLKISLSINAGVNSVWTAFTINANLENLLPR